MIVTKSWLQIIANRQFAQICPQGIISPRWKSIRNLAPCHLACTATNCGRLRCHHGAPISRPRLFILFIRKELMIKAAAEDFGFITECMKTFQMTTDIDWNHGRTCGSISNKPFQFPVALVPKNIFIILQHISTLRMDLMLPNDHWAVERDMNQRANRKKERFSSSKQLATTM